MAETRKVKESSAAVTTRKPKQYKRSILLVDADAVSVRDVQEALEHHEFNILWGPSAQRAREILNARSVQCVMVDRDLEGEENGIACIVNLLNNHAWREIPIIASAASDDTKFEALVRKLGVNGFLPKPLDKKQVRRSMVRATH